MLEKILKEPLLHFLTAGLVLFLAYGAVESGNGFETNDQIIVVDRAVLLTFLQFRSRSFDPESAGRILDAMPDEVRNGLIEEYVREEALYRDALAFGLDEGDDIIRRRMVQKAEYLAQGFVELGLDVNEGMIRAYFDVNREIYREPALITFTHVFFDAERRGEAAAVEAANTAIIVLNENDIAFSEAIEYGDRFPFHLNYVERGSEEVAAHFGIDMAEEVFGATPSESVWRGPFQSPYGAHVVMVTLNRPANDPELAEVRARVVLDLREVEMHRRTEEAIDGIVAAYDVRIDLSVRHQEGP